MTHINVILINVFGVLVSIFSIYVTGNIYRKYRLKNSVFFILSSIAILIWNVLHLIFNYIGEDFDNFSLIKVLWLIVVYSGMMFVYMFIFGFSSLRYENLNWRLVVYAAFGSAFSVLFAVMDEWVTVSYSLQDGWVTNIIFQQFWTLFSFLILLIYFLELIIPLVNTYSRTIVDKNVLLVMLLAILFAIFSNALEPMLTETGLPQAIRFLVADVGFLVFFIILYRYPFTGLYDSTKLNRVIVASEDGVPKLLLPDDEDLSILASGALISINAILEEITTARSATIHNGIETTRKIELGSHQFYLILRAKLIIIFQFQNPSGVCFSKFKSLARIFTTENTPKIAQRMQMLVFRNTLKEYFKDFSTETYKEISS